jgi:hypothetical protein
VELPEGEAGGVLALEDAGTSEDETPLLLFVPEEDVPGGSRLGKGVYNYLGPGKGSVSDECFASHGASVYFIV